jgi:hypothetical protein
MKLVLFFLLLATIQLKAQTSERESPSMNMRLGFLLFPGLSPLLTLETMVFQNLTVQLETNVLNTHGINLKYFIHERMNGHYAFIGNAFIESNYLRKDNKVTFLPYAGYGYTYRFGKIKDWIFDSRIGVGQTINASNNIVLPVIKAGIGRIF